MILVKAVLFLIMILFAAASVITCMAGLLPLALIAFPISALSYYAGRKL